ncbi:MAG: glycosyltransferase family 2 protein [Nanoarchaeota archaeon]|nr:glycosyltransferase family 2 protein [Nanoarchaeota archaeon]
MKDLLIKGMAEPFVIVMIPAYNEEDNIGKVIREIPRDIDGVKDVKVLVMDDNSIDGTAEVAKKAGADYILRQKQNVGLGNNFKRGIDVALKYGADIIVTIDGDGQFDAADIPSLLKPILEQEADVVTASRFLNPSLTKNMPWIKKWGNRRFTNLVSRITGQKFSDSQCGFRAYNREAGLRINTRGKFTYTQEVFIDLLEKGMRIKEVPAHVSYDKNRKSMVSGSLSRYGFKSLGIIAKTTRDTQPLTFFGVPGMILFFLGFLGGAYSFFYWLAEHATTPVRTLLNISIFLVIAGLSLGILGLLADMLKTIRKDQQEILYRLKKRDFTPIQEDKIRVAKRSRA